MSISSETWDPTSLTDTHCHVDQLTLEAWQGFYTRALAAGVKNFVWVSTSYDSYEKTRILVGKNHHGSVSLGLHPHEAKAYAPEQWEIWFATKSYLAVGECGLDDHYKFSPSEAQDVAFEHQLKMARLHHKPVIVHVREAFERAIHRIQQSSKQGVLGVVHCFTGNATHLRKIIDAGWYVGFTGIITFQKQAQEIRDALKVAPLDRILLETDAPYLAPHPYRGKSNESSFLPIIAHKVAEIKGVSLDEIIALTTANANRLFLGK